VIWLWILLAALLIIGPAFALLPSARQKEQIAMRRFAMGEGAVVELTKTDDPDPDGDDYLTATGKPLPQVLSVVAYRLHRPPSTHWRKMDPIDWCVVRRQAAVSPVPGWEWLTSPQQVNPDFTAYLTAAVGRLPADVVKVEEKASVISVYWKEVGGAASAEVIVDFLKATRDVPVHLPLEEDD
jgi:hypothetical protein